MRVMKRALTLLLVLSMLLGIFAMTAGAQTAPKLIMYGVMSDGTTLFELYKDTITGDENTTFANFFDSVKKDFLFDGRPLLEEELNWKNICVDQELTSTPKFWNTRVTAITEDVVLYAALTPAKEEEADSVYYVRFDKNADDAVGTMADQEISYADGGTLNASTFTREGYTFSGWNTMRDGGGMPVSDKASIAADRPLAAVGSTATLYAQWTKDPAPSIPCAPAPDVGTKIYDAVTVSCGKELHDAISYDYIVTKDSQMRVVQGTDKVIYCYITLSDSEASAYLAEYNNDTFGKHHATNKNFPEITLVLVPFVGWTLTDDADITTTCDCTCNKWHKHVITYTDGVRNEVVFPDVVKYALHGSYTPTIKDPVRPGYKFVGWSPKVSAKATACVTYVAQWQKVKTPALTSKHVAYLQGYGDGTVRPNGNITRAEAITMLYRLMDASSAKEFYTRYNCFTDVAKDAWYNDAVSTLANAGVLYKTSGKLNPNEAITRAEFFYMLTKFSNVTYTGKCGFKDVAHNHWAYDELVLAQYLGWIIGYGDNMVHPDDTITRAEVAASLNRVLDRDNCKTTDKVNYTDNPVNAWYYQDIVEASNTH